jgi:hypothetical protein
MPNQIKGAKTIGPVIIGTSALNPYKPKLEREGNNISPGQTYPLEWGVSQNLAKTVDLRVSGYHQQEITEDGGIGSSRQGDRVAGIGPQSSTLFASLTQGVSIRCAYEFMAERRLQGHILAFSVTKGS